MATKAKTQERDHIDRFLESIRERLPMLDPEVEGIVDRIGGLHRRFQRAMDETLTEFKLDYAEYKLLGLLTREGEVYRSSPGKLARMMELSSGAMTNRLDRLEKAGFLRRFAGPHDPRRNLGGLSPARKRGFDEGHRVPGRQEAPGAPPLRVPEQKQPNPLPR